MNHIDQVPGRHQAQQIVDPLKEKISLFVKIYLSNFVHCKYHLANYYPTMIGQGQNRGFQTISTVFEKSYFQQKSNKIFGSFFR